MNCWDILGIEPTGDLERIRQAYERQMKFASEDDARALEQALREAMGDEPSERAFSQNRADAQHETAQSTAETDQEHDVEERVLSAGEAQIAREVVIQIKALMNDDRRQQDSGIWKAILCESPADQPVLRREIARQLEPRIRPMAENGGLPVSVAQFLGDWFDWSSAREASQAAAPRHQDSRHSDPRNYPEPDMASEQDSPDQPPMTNFWPAVIGWIVGLVILATIFGGMGQ
ncbi:J domain-containing protein [Marinobacter sp.]|uniref:J domain-containing protein n=1 Tax=Marinobacter sp. TaxID=50741 RepID=UPI001A0DB27D|nr:J domain-containing protein [Marinobacter sp.]MBE0485650.1 J domain-containing protein [Marinobacter sp.]